MLENRQKKHAKLNSRVRDRGVKYPCVPRILGATEEESWLSLASRLDSSRLCRLPRLPVPRCLLVPAPADRNAHLLLGGKGSQGSNQTSEPELQYASDHARACYISGQLSIVWRMLLPGHDTAATESQAPIAPCFEFMAVLLVWAD
jgi:hypothetical protein